MRLRLDENPLVYDYSLDEKPWVYDYSIDENLSVEGKRMPKWPSSFIRAGTDSGPLAAAAAATAATLTTTPTIVDDCRRPSSPPGLGCSVQVIHRRLFQ
jgi:hypothetical protein